MIKQGIINAHAGTKVLLNLIGHAHAVCMINALCLTMTSSCLQGLPFHSPVYNTYYVCKYVLWMEEPVVAGGKQSEPPCLYCI